MDRNSGEKFSWRQRIVRSADFRALYDKGRRYETGYFVLFGRSNDLGFHRLGLTVSRKVGCAVVRNRIKRLFREIFRRCSAQIPCQYDLVVNAKRDSAAASYSALREEFLAAARKICR